MRLSLDYGDGNYLIRAYRPGTVTVNDQHIEHSLIVTPNYLTDWQPQQFDELQAAHFEELLALEPELVLLGTGTRQQFPHPQLIQSLLQQGIGVEAMDTGAACRTYNIVMAEGRRVVAALIID